ncbi:MAG TPA: polyprenol monophosphomannose synthase [Thermoanaerobaculia bacterium]|nr:polyprenol monophosphomannose synthase [Thermoanaerobaculia bacterium]
MSRTPPPASPELERLETRLLLVSPTFNERGNLEELVTRVFAAAPRCNLLIVDDGSPDGTGALCRELATRHPGLQLLERNGPRGLGRAYVAGLQYGLDHGFEVIGTLDADLSHDPAHLRSMLAMTLAHDVVVGSRYVRDGGTINWRIRRILLSWLANRFAAWLLRIPVHDTTSGYRLYRASALAEIPLDRISSTGYSFLVELLYRLHRAGCSIGESPIVFYDRTLGESKLGAREIYVGAMRLLLLRTSRVGSARPRPQAVPRPHAGS